MSTLQNFFSSVAADSAATATSGVAAITANYTSAVVNNNLDIRSRIAPDSDARLQVYPEANNKIPLVYGSAYISGILTDVELDTNGVDLYVVSTVCEVTGTKLSDSLASEFAFDDVLINDQRVIFNSDGITVQYTEDREGNRDYSLVGLCSIKCYAGGSASTYNVAPTGYSIASQQAAWDFIPSWATNHTMNDLVFAVARLTYNQDKGITTIPTFKFKITNSMTKPGDCIYDYMTSTRYGAGIDPGEIYSA